MAFTGFFQFSVFSFQFSVFSFQAACLKLKTVNGKVRARTKRGSPFDRPSRCQTRCLALSPDHSPIVAKTFPQNRFSTNLYGVEERPENFFANSLESANVGAIDLVFFYLVAEDSF